MKPLRTLTALLAGLALSQAAMAVSLSVSLVNQTKNIGDSLSVDVVMSKAANEIITGYDINVGYNAAILGLTNVTFGTSLGAPLDSFGGWSGTVRVDETSFLTDAALDGMQTSSFTLFTLYFDALSAGTSGLSLSANSLSGAATNDPLIQQWNAALSSLTSVVNGSVTVLGGGGGPNPVPLPGAVWLFGSALLGFAGFSRAKKRS